MEEKGTSSNGDCNKKTAATQAASPAPLLKQNWTLYLTFCNFNIVTGSALMFGFNSAAINAPYAVMSAYVNETFYREGKVLSKEDLSVWWSVVVALHLIGGIVGSIWFPTALVAALGKRNSMMVAAGIGALGGFCSFITPWTRSYVPLLVGRAVVGFSTGIDMVVAAALINEQVPARLRGAFGSLFANGSASGVCLANLLGLTYILGRSFAWQYLFLIVAIFYILHGICLFFTVDSPKDLIVQKKDDEAIKVLMRLRNATQEEVMPEYEATKRAIQAESEIHDISFRTLFTRRPLWWPLIVVINLHIVSQCTGLGAAFYYATKVMRDAGLEADTAALANFGISFATVVGNFVNAGLSDRFGRRPLEIIGLAIVMGANVMLTIVIIYRVTAAAAVGFALFLICFGSGPGPTPYYMSAELTSRPAKQAALAIGMFVNWSGRILISFIFPLMTLHIGAYSFLPFAGVCFVELCFMIPFLPETSTLVVDYDPEDFAQPGSLLQLKPRRKKQPAIAAVAKNGDSSKDSARCAAENGSPNV